MNKTIARLSRLFKPVGFIDAPDNSLAAGDDLGSTAMDDLDRRLLALLSDDARLPVKTIAGRLGIARNTVESRLRRLRGSGVIDGFTVRPGPAALAGRVRAVMMVTVANKRPEEVLVALSRLDGVGMVHTTNGRWDLIAELSCADLRSFDRVLSDARGVAGVAETESCLLLASRPGSEATRLSIASAGADRSDPPRED